MGMDVTDLTPLFYAPAENPFASSYHGKQKKLDSEIE
jgi:hypothetical protein